MKLFEILSDVVIGTFVVLAFLVVLFAKLWPLWLSIAALVYINGA